MAKKKAKGGVVYPLERIRNIGIIAHIDAGKTTTTEQILYYTGKEHRIGSVDEGNTTTDHLPEEQERGITIVSAAVTTHWTPTWEGSDEHRINIIDTPGHIDFTAEVERALSVLDGAIGIFCGVGGVQAQSETVWRQATHYGVPRIAYVNKLDRAGANFYDVVTEVQERLQGPRAMAIQVPIGEEKEFRGVVDLVTMQSYVWEDGDQPPPPTVGPIPDDAREEAELYREEMITRLADLDDEVANRVMEDQPCEPELVRAALRRCVLNRTVCPVLCGASFRHKGVQPLLDAICSYLPAPTDRPPIEGKRPKSKRKVLDESEDSWLPADRPPTTKAPFCALAFKTVTTKTGDLVYLRVYSGEASGSDQLLNINKNKKERMGRIHVMHANRKEPIEVARVGDIIGVVGTRYTVTGDTLTNIDSPIRLGAITFPLPVVSMAVEPRSTGDKDKLVGALDSMAKDDPTFTVHIDPNTSQTIISGMGELHLEIIENSLKRDWKVEAKVGKPRVSYKATVKAKANGKGVCEKELGGKRHFAELRLSVERDSEAQGVKVVFGVGEEELSEEIRILIQDDIRTKAYSVGDYGDPLINCKVKITGVTTDDDSTEAAFSEAASKALDAALESSGLVFLEPIMTLTVDVPEEFYGNVIQDLQGRRAEVSDTKVIKDMRRITAAVPLAEMFGYAGDLRSKSQGRATPSLEPQDYAEVPAGKRPKLF